MATPLHAADPLGLAVDKGNQYGGAVHHHYDGDTVFASIWDPLIGVPLIVGVRVRGVQAPELHDPGGREVAAALAAQWPPGTVVQLADVGPYPRPGHVTATLHLGKVDVATWLLSQGFAVPYDGTGVKPVVPWPPAPRPAP